MDFSEDFTKNFTKDFNGIFLKILLGISLTILLRILQGKDFTNDFSRIYCPKWLRCRVLGAPKSITKCLTFAQISFQMVNIDRRFLFFLYFLFMLDTVVNLDNDIDSTLRLWPFLVSKFKCLHVGDSNSSQAPRLWRTLL